MYKRILFPIDIVDKSSWLSILPQVVAMVKNFNAELYLMNVIPDYGMGMVQEYFPKGWIEDLINKSDDALKQIIKDHFPSELKIKTHVGRGAIYQSVTDFAEASRSDLIIIPAFREQSREFLLGPNAAKVVRHSKISVLVVRE